MFISVTSSGGAPIASPERTPRAPPCHLITRGAENNHQHHPPQAQPQTRVCAVQPAATFRRVPLHPLQNTQRRRETQSSPATPRWLTGRSPLRLPPLPCVVHQKGTGPRRTCGLWRSKSCPCRSKRSTSTRN
ncbi:unnamed protein product [Ixodes pacificus]